MAISKVIYKSSASATPEIWIDATTATAAAEDITSPKTAMLADGEMTEGTGSGGGGGPTLIASGTYTGTGSYPANPGEGFFVGTKMPQTDFWVKFVARANSEFPYNTDSKYSYGAAIAFSDLGYFDLSTEADSKEMIPTIPYAIAMYTTSPAGGPVRFANYITSATFQNGLVPNKFLIDRRSNGFYVRIFLANSSFKYSSGIIFDWEVVYFGSNPSTDIVEIA